MTYVTDKAPESSIINHSRYRLSFLARLRREKSLKNHKFNLETKLNNSKFIKIIFLMYLRLSYLSQLLSEKSFLSKYLETRSELYENIKSLMLKLSPKKIISMQDEKRFRCYKILDTACRDSKLRKYVRYYSGSCTCCCKMLKLSK